MVIIRIIVLLRIIDHPVKAQQGVDGAADVDVGHGEKTERDDGHGRNP